MKASLSLNKNNSGQTKKFHFYDTKAERTVTYTVPKKDGLETSSQPSPNPGPAFKDKVTDTFNRAYQENTKKIQKRASSKFTPPILSNKSEPVISTLNQFQSSKKSNSSANASKNIISNFFIKPNDNFQGKDIIEKSSASPYLNSSRQIPVGKATILRGCDQDDRSVNVRNVGSNLLKIDNEEKENLMTSKRTFSEFYDRDNDTNQPSDFKRLKTVENAFDEDEDDQLLGNLFNCDDDESYENNEYHADNYEYAQDPESDFDFNIPSPRTPEYLSPDNSPPHFSDDNDIDKHISVTKAFPEAKANVQTTQTEKVERERLLSNDLQADWEQIQVPEDDGEAKFEKSCANYVLVLEEIADTLKTLDADLLQNVLGNEKYETYKKRQVERNRLRAEKRRLTIERKAKRSSSSQSSFLSRNESISQNITVNGDQSTPYDASLTRRFSADCDLPPCGDSVFEKSPPVSETNLMSKANAHLLRNSMLQPSKDIANLQSNSTSPITSTWRASNPAFQNQSIPDIINIEDDEILPYCPGPNQRKSSATPTRSNERPSNVSSCKHPSKKIGNSLPDDGYRREFKRTDYAFSGDMKIALRQSYGLKCFRSNQQEAITAAMLKKDCFILMPTGGGKSLCYQLPAIISHGVTIVVSPLKSLIQDQVMKLVSNHIPAYQMTGETPESAVNSIYRDLHSLVPETKLLYVTPEKLSASSKLLSALQNLYQRKYLSRFVIDEAHCVSQWGHDFRPDYKKLSALKEKFPLVPMMALTATATPRVRKDIVTQLRMKTPMWFSQSFNRPNLQFLLRPKKGKVVEQITETIKKSHAGDSGIIYCLSRNECDKVADDLRKAGIQAVAYHAGLSDSKRARIQEDWIRDKCKVICATVAFGMGIDKADVRFVFHHSIPKSLEGYFQECGRAGRDGQNSVCMLFYTYSDVYRLKRMVLSDQTMNKESVNVHMNNLYRVVQYCENQTECRRAQLLEYFGETGFDIAKCRENQSTICDNCSCSAEMVEMDVTQTAKMIVESVNTLIHRGNGNWRRPMAQLTLKHLVDVFKGSQNAKVERESLHRCVMYGKGDANFHRNDSERLFRMLVMQDVLAEDLTTGAHSQVISYAKLGPKAMDFLNGKVKLPRFFKRGTKSSKCGIDTKGDTCDNNNVTNTCYEQLVSCCKRIAEENGLKPHHVFADVTLRQMADKLPMTREEMLDIEGVTEYKMDQFGQQFLELTLAYSGGLLTSDSDMINDFDGMRMDNDRMSTGNECESPYWASSGNFTAQNKKSKFKKRGKFQSKKKKSNNQTTSKSKNTSKKSAAPPSNTNNHINNPIVNKFQNFSKNRNLGSGRNPGFLSVPPKR